MLLNICDMKWKVCQGLHDNVQCNREAQRKYKVFQHEIALQNKLIWDCLYFWPQTHSSPLNTSSVEEHIVLHLLNPYTVVYSL